ncbi:MAG TPA: hypothetical protein VGD68_17760 [Streptosporangiaceae bacterium]
MGNKRSLTPLAAVAGGFMAGAVGTVAMDTYLYLRYRRSGGTDRPLAWEFPPVQNWEQAPAPGQVARRVVEGFTQKPLPDRYANLTSTIMHWGYGSANGVPYGVVAGSLRRPNPAAGLPFGVVVWLTGYAVLPLGGLYQPIWKYDVKTLAGDLSGHLVFGAATGTAFWLFTRLF